MNRDEIALMYSGGLDTTYAALKLADKFSKVHLLTFCNGICVCVNNSKKHIALLQDRFGDKFHHSIIPISHILDLVKNGIMGDIKRYKSPLLFDLCCRLSMEIATILYCLDKRIGNVSDGNNPKTQGQMFIQQSDYLKKVDKFFSFYNINSYRSYDTFDSREEISSELKKSGIDTGSKWLKYMGISTQLFTQPFCLWAPVAFLFTSDLRKIPIIKPFALSVDKAIEYRLEKERIAHRFIDYLRYNYPLSYQKGCTKRIAGFFKCATNGSKRSETDSN